jgi:hypothetical protein
MNEESLGIIIFALIALGAVFAFLFVLGGPQAETTGQLAGSQKIGTSWYKYRDAFAACAHAHCSDGLPAIPTGEWDRFIGAYQCVCQTSDPNLEMYRSRYAPG